MSKEKQTIDVQSRQRTQRKNEPDLAVEQMGEELISVEKLSNSLVGSTNSDSVQTYAALLDNTHILTEQRKAMAAHIGRVGGNQYLQRVMLQRQNHLEEEANLNQQNRSSITPLHKQGDMTIQRQARSTTSAPTSTGSAHISRGAVRFYRLPSFQMGILLINGRAYTEPAGQLIDKFHEMGNISEELRGAVEFLEFSENTQGSRDVSAIENVGEAASRLRGRRRRQLREAIDRYNTQLPLARGKAERVGAAKQRVIAAINRVHGVRIGGQILTGRREEAEGEQAVSDVQSRQSEAETWAGEVFDAAFDALTGDWKGALKGLAKFAGRELIAKGLVESHYEAELNQARQRLQAVRERIRSLEDEAQLASFREAVAELNEAQSLLRAETQELPSLVRDAEVAHETLYQQLNHLGSSGQEAAGALDTRVNLAEEATRAEGLASRYDNILSELRDSATTLERNYRHYAEMVNSPGGESAIPNSNIRVALWNRANDNRETCTRLIQWITEEIPRLENVRSYIQGGTYMRSYDEGMEGALHDIHIELIS